MKLPVGSWIGSDFMGSRMLARFVSIENVPAIYRIVHVASGRFYVGSTKNARGRIKRHFYDLQARTHHSPILQRAWIKYGAAAFRFEVIEYVADRSWLLLHEQAYIDAFKDKSALFNTCMQAGNCAGVVRSPASIEKFRKTIAGRVMSEDWCRAISAGKKGLSTPAMKAAALASRFSMSAQQVG